MSLRTMRMAQGERAQSGASRQPIQIPAPMRGHFGRSDYAAADPSVGFKTTNLFGDGTEVKVRPGYADASGFPSNCYQAWPFEFGGERRATFRTSTGLASDDGSVTIDRSFTGDIMASEISNRLAYAGGGVAPILWDGSSFSDAVLTMPSGAPDALSDLTGVVAHHDRLFFWNSNGDECRFYYLTGVGAITGTLESFPLYALGNVKGRVSTMVSLSIDAGHGANDVLAIVMTTGQVVVYEGFDPGDETDWRLWGRVPGTSENVSPNAVVNVATDAYITTTLGVLSLRTLLSQGVEGVVNAPSDAIGGDLQDVIDAGISYRGWQMERDPKGRFVLLNYPTAADSYAQWAFSYKAQGWFNWTLPARWWFERAGELYFIDTDGDVKIFGAVGDAGQDIVSAWWTPWISLSPQDVAITSLQVDLMSKTAESLSAVCLTDRRATAAAIAENTQTVALPTQDAADGTFQNLDETFLVNQHGRFVQFRFTLTAQEAKWLGATINP